MQVWTQKTKGTKYQRVEVTDRQHICIRQDPIVEETQKSSGRPGWPAPFVTHSQRPGETDTLEYQPLALVLWHINFTALSTSGTLFPASYSYPGPPRLCHRPPLGQCSISSQTESTQTNCGCLDLLTLTIKTADAVSFHSHQMNQSGWTCPLNSLLVSSSVMS